MNMGWSVLAAIQVPAWLYGFEFILSICTCLKPSSVVKTSGSLVVNRSVICLPYINYGVFQRIAIFVEDSPFKVQYSTRVTWYRQITSEWSVSTIVGP